MNGSGYAAAFNQFDLTPNYAQAAPNSWTTGNSANNPQQSNNPCHEGYRPHEKAAHPPSAYNPTTGTTVGANTNHHSLLVGYAAAAAAAGAPGLSLLVQQAQQQQQQQSNPASHMLQSFDSLAPAPHQQNGRIGCSHQQQQHHQHHPLHLQTLHHQQQHHQHHAGPSAASAPAPQSRHQRHTSLDELLMMSPSLLGGAGGAPSFDDGLLGGLLPAPALSSNSSSTQQHQQPPQQPQQQEQDIWLSEISLEVPSLSLKPMSGAEVLARIRVCQDHVLQRYLPCTEFLVQCQQDLRKALAFKQRSQHHRQSQQFYQSSIHGLPQTFYLKNQWTMDRSALGAAVEGLEKLRRDAKNASSGGCDAMKNVFLGGMKDGESWGLRKWLSKHGSALPVCTDLECILAACQKLDRSAETTRKLAGLLRPLAKRTLDRLKSEIPATYQERSTAHPYLPFFHRLEAALRGMSQFDPDDDDVICIDDDDEIEVLKAQKPAAIALEENNASSSVTLQSQRTTSPYQPQQYAKGASNNKPKSKKRKAGETGGSQLPVVRLRLSHKPTPPADDESSSGESAVEDVIEVVDVKPVQQTGNEKQWRCMECFLLNTTASDRCSSCSTKNGKMGQDVLALESDLAVLDERRLLVGNSSAASSFGDSDPAWPVQANSILVEAGRNLSDSLEQLAELFEEGRQREIRPILAPACDVWEGERFARALRLFATLARSPDACGFAERVDDDALFQQGSPRFSHVIRNPLCFRDIVEALADVQDDCIDGKDGVLPLVGLGTWNMWKGTDLLQAIDLALLNSLAYDKTVCGPKTEHRTKTNKLRRALWHGINSVVQEVVGNDPERKKQCTPTRRGESSGFVVYKIRER